MLIAQMVGRNEANRYLPQVLERLSSQVDTIVFTDDCSDDATYEMAQRYAQHVNRTERPLFMENEYALRTAAWKNLEIVASPGDWILCIDCDEEFFPTPQLPAMLAQKECDLIGITFFHMWNQTQYRVDKAWHPTISSRLFRYQEGGVFKERNLACGAEPTYVLQYLRNPTLFLGSELRMKHLGYMDDQDKINKHERYMKLDGGNFHSLAHLQSIVDPSPTLIDWVD